MFYSEMAATLTLVFVALSAKFPEPHAKPYLGYISGIERE